MSKIPDQCTPEIMEKIFDLVSIGKTIREACVIGGKDFPSYETVYRAIAISKEYADRYARAREAQMLVWEEQIIEIASDDSRDINEDGKYNTVFVQRDRLRLDTIKWVMSKRNARVFGERQQREMIIANSGPLQDELKAADLSKLTDEELKQLESIQDKLKS